MQSGEWRIRFISLKDNAGNNKLYYQSEFSQGYKFNLKSVFQGTETKSIQKGTQFNALKGVTANSSMEGDFTDKITYTGTVDTNNEGVYLIKYEAIGKNGDLYKDYRWITVVNNIDNNKDGKTKGIYFNKQILIGLSNLFSLSSINITKDGNSYTIGDDGIIAEEGTYKISFSSTGSDSVTGIGELAIEFTIDKTSPLILENHSQIADEGTPISADKFVNASDNSGEVNYSYVTEPDWSKVGIQNVKIVVKDLAGNDITQEVLLTIMDKCDIDKDGIVDIFDLVVCSKRIK